jgi:hypothetical protein
MNQMNIKEDDEFQFNDTTPDENESNLYFEDLANLKNRDHRISATSSMMDSDWSSD